MGAQVAADNSRIVWGGLCVGLTLGKLALALNADAHCRLSLCQEIAAIHTVCQNMPHEEVWQAACRGAGAARDL